MQQGTEMKAHYLEDLTVGMAFESGPYRLGAEEIREYALRYDPQPFHTDPVAAEDSFFQGLAASGWHTAAITMRLMVLSGLKPPGGLIGAGVDGLRWFQPVRPGDELSARIEVVEARPMNSRPDQGLVKIRVVTGNQRGERVLEFTASIVVPRRDGAGESA
jgi:acyl dehydratase